MKININVCLDVNQVRELDLLAKSRKFSRQYLLKKFIEAGLDFAAEDPDAFMDTDFEAVSSQ